MFSSFFKCRYLHILISYHLFRYLEVLARSTSVKESLQILAAGTELWKVRDKGGIRGFRWYKRKYRLDLKHLEIKYSPHKGANKKVDPANCVKGEQWR